MKLALCVCHCIGELTRSYVCLSDLFHEQCFFFQYNTMMLMRIQDSNRKFQFMPYNAYWLYKV